MNLIEISVCHSFSKYLQETGVNEGVNKSTAENIRIDMQKETTESSQKKL